MAKLSVLVTGSTGKQGGHVARQLLKKGHNIFALTRKADSAAAKELSQLGAKVVIGDLIDKASLERTAESVDAIFGMSSFEVGTDTETKQGITLADVAKSKNKYFVFSSIANANKNTGIPHFESKWKIEQHISKIGLGAAILAPVHFMENVYLFTKPQLREGIYANPLRPDRKLAQLALDDLAGLVVLALENKSRFVGKRIDIASDDLTGNQAAETLGRTLGKPLKYFQVPMDNIRKMSDDVAKMYEWFERVGYSVDLAALRKDYPEVRWHTYETWAKEQDWKKILST